MSGGGGGGLPGLGYIQSFFHSSHEGGGLHIEARPLLIIFAVMLVCFLILSPSQTLRNFNLVLFLAPLWVPAALVNFSFYRFVQSRRAEFIMGQPGILLELKLPRETKKTPLSMETVLTNLNFSAGETTWWKKYFKGGVRPWWSLEIASIGGQVRFFIWTRASLRRGVEAFFYAQYPGIEIIEAEDYSRLVDPSDPTQHEMFGAEYVLTKPDPFPIKTYDEFGLDQAGAKPEEQTDPLAQIVELLGSIGPQEQFWFQICFRRTGGERFAKGETWENDATRIVEEVRAKIVQKRTVVDPKTGELRETQGFPNPTEIEKLLMLTVQANAGRPGFDVGIRSIYSARLGHLQPSMITFLINMLKPFQGWNAFKLASLFSAKFNDYPWEDRHGHHKQHEHEKIVHFYRRRAYFHNPYSGPWMILSNRELATIFHIPSSTIETPGLPRIGSATNAAPSNLPT